jgi:hypothetical protein
VAATILAFNLLLSAEQVLTETFRNHYAYPSLVPIVDLFNQIWLNEPRALPKGHEQADSCGKALLDPSMQLLTIDAPRWQIRPASLIRHLLDLTRDRAASSRAIF